MRENKITPFLACALLLLVGCTKEKRAGSSSSIINPPGASNLASLQSDIFAFGCATSGCHDNRANPAAGLNMSSSAQTYVNLVNQLSIQATSRRLVVANDPGSSYLIDKMRGTHQAVGGSGARMPLYAAAVSSADLDRIITWINNGAPND
jgi:hypothetical protein